MKFIKSPIGLIVLVLLLFWMYSAWRGNNSNGQEYTRHTSEGGPRATARPVVPTSAAVEGWTP